MNFLSPASDWVLLNHLLLLRSSRLSPSVECQLESCSVTVPLVTNMQDTWQPHRGSGHVGGGAKVTLKCMYILAGCAREGVQRGTSRGEVTSVRRVSAAVSSACSKPPASRPALARARCARARHARAPAPGQAPPQHALSRTPLLSRRSYTYRMLVLTLRVILSFFLCKAARSARFTAFASFAKLCERARYR